LLPVVKTAVNTAAMNGDTMLLLLYRKYSVYSLEYSHPSASKWIGNYDKANC